MLYNHYLSILIQHVTVNDYIHSTTADQFGKVFGEGLLSVLNQSKVEWKIITTGIMLLKV